MSPSPSPARRRRAALRCLPALAAAAVLAAAVRCVAFAGLRSASAASELRRPFRHHLTAPYRRVAAGNGEEEGPKEWQRGLDTALLDVDAAPSERLGGLLQALSRPGEITQAVGAAAAAIASRGLQEGHPEALDALWPKGTLARSDLEGLVAVARQLPEVAQGLQDRASGGQDTAMPPSAAPGGGFAGAAAALPKILSPEAWREASEEVKNIFRRTPKGLEEPSFEVVEEGEGFEIRRYRPFTVAKRRMADEGGDNFASADGFYGLANYLFGNNSEQRSMAMTMPVEISYDSEERSMSFVLPTADVAADGGPPSPLDPTVQVASIPERLVAVREFPGVATAGEVDRQREKLMGALEAAGGSFAAVAGEEYSVLQYNPPYTLPWRRRNEVALVVTEVDRLGSQPPVLVLAEDEEAA